MEILKKRIIEDGVVKPGRVLKVDSFLNHQMDIALFQEMAREWKRRFAGVDVNKIMTIEASGIGIAAIVAAEFDLPVVFAKKAHSINLDGSVYTSKIHSYTHQRDYDVIVSKKYIGAQDRVLIIDDFLANGCAMDGLVEICEQAGACVVGIGIAIEKGFQQGGAELRARGLRVDSLAVIESMDDQTGEISFR